jgi:crotonobetainyl-CoA:carnitine CoA-transferase CaiB-like acyl-CoA transferase
MFASTAILAALRALDVTGKGQLLDLSLMDSVVALLANVASNYLVGGVEPSRMGNAHFNIAPYEVFRTKDRWIGLGALNAGQWHMLCEVVGRPDLEEDPRFATNQDRVKNRAQLDELLNDSFARLSADEWLEKLQDVGIPCGPINTIEDVFNHPQAAARNLKIEIEHPTAGMVCFPGFPYKMSETPAELHRPPPMLGEHTDEVLRGLLGYSDEEMVSLRERGVV